MWKIKTIWFATLCLEVVWAGCHGLPNTVELPTEHQLPMQQLVFHSDFPLPSDHRLIHELSAERNDVSDVLGMPCGEEPIDVYLFRDAQTYHQYIKDHLPEVPDRRAFFIESEAGLAIYAHWSDRVAEDLRHEVAHGYMHSALSGLPLWLDEGLAEYFEVPRNLHGLNRPHVELLADLIAHHGWKPNLRRLEKLTEAGQMQQHDYAESWAWVHFLIETEPERQALLSEHLQQLREPGPAEPLSQRLASMHVQPERTLVEYITMLQEENE